MKLRSNSTNSTGVKRGLIDAFDERLSNTKSLKTNQGNAKRFSHFYDKDIEIDVECHYEDFKKENVKVEPDVHIKSGKEFEVNSKSNFRTLRNRKIISGQAAQKRVKIEADVYIKNENIIEFKNFKLELDLHIKCEKEFKVNPKSNFRTLRNQIVNLAEQLAPLKNVNIEKEKLIEGNIPNNSCDIEQDHVKRTYDLDNEIIVFESHNELHKKDNIKVEGEVNNKKEEVIEETIKNNFGDIQRASHNDDREIAELIESHDVRHKLENVKEQPKVRIVTEKRIDAACTLLQQAAPNWHNVGFEEKEHVVKKKVIEVGAPRTRNKKKVKKNFQSHRECCQSYQSFLNCLKKFNREVQRGCKYCVTCFFGRGFCVEFYQLVHVIVVKNEIKKCICHECGMEFTNISILKIHIDYTHKKLFTSPIILKWDNKTSGCIRFIPVRTL